MTRPRTLPAALGACLALVVAACGTEQPNTRERGAANPVRQGSLLFNERCGGCHTLSAAATQGSTPQGEVKYKERTDGPNLDYRKESVNDVLFAIRNGGFSGAIMPANVVVGPDQQKVAEFVSKYAGTKASASAGK